MIIIICSQCFGRNYCIIHSNPVLSVVQVRLGSSQETSEVGSLVVTSLCPAIERVVRDGMKPCLTGLHIFGKIQLSPWRMTESSAEIGELEQRIFRIQCNTTLLPSVNTIVLGMFCGARYTHHMVDWV